MAETAKRIHNADKQAIEHDVPSWRLFRTIFSFKFHKKCKENTKPSKRIWCSSSICHSTKDSSSVVRTIAVTPEAEKKLAEISTSSRYFKGPKYTDSNGTIFTSFSSASSAAITASSQSLSFSSLGGSFRTLQQRRFPGCYEWGTMSDTPIYLPCRDPSLRTNLNPSSEQWGVCMKPEVLELHHSTTNAVTELGREDTGRNVIEIIFKTSWLQRLYPVCKIDRILKVHNTQKTIARFEDYRDSIKAAARELSKEHPRCVADGNELLRFYSTTFTCSLGVNGLTNLCQSAQRCNACSIIRDGFKVDKHGGIQTMATSRRAHDVMKASPEEKRAMFLCRVIAGRVKRSPDASEECDSVSISARAYSNMDELLVFNPRAVLPCFVVVYNVF